MSETSYVAVVDDDEGVRRSLGRLLRAAGFQPVTYPSAEAFLADTKRPAFDCLVLDIRLEGISGIVLGQRLASMGWTTPVVFITAYDGPELRERALRIPCSTYLPKTAPAETVFAAIRAAIQAHASASAARP